MKRAIKFLLLAAMLLTMAAFTISYGAGVSTNNAVTKPAAVIDILTPEQQAANFKPGFDAGISNATKRIELDPENVTAYANRGHYKLSKHDYDGAIADYTKIIELNKRFIDGAYYDRGLAKQAKGDFDGAVADFTKANELRPSSEAKTYLSFTYSSRGFAKYSKHDLDGAIADCTKAIEINPDNASAFYNRGLAESAKGDLVGAKADFTAALKLNPGLSEAQMRLVELN